MRSFRLYVTVMMAVIAATAAEAQTTKLQRRKAKVDSVLTARYYKTRYDTNYVVRPEGRWTLKLRFNHSGNNFHVKEEKDGVTSKADLSTSRKTTLSIGASFMGISASLAINPAKLSGAYDDYELNLSYFSNSINIDASYQRATTLSGDIHDSWEEGQAPNSGHPRQLATGDVNLKVFNIAGYYVFNHKRFSYPAAFTQSYLQRRSAGSWLAGFSYQGGSIRSRDELKKREPSMPDIHISVGHIGIGGGYGYNWVLNKKWLMHLSLTPTVVIYNNNYIEKDGVKTEATSIRLNMIFNERAAIVYNFSPRFFTGATFVMSSSWFKDKIITVNQNKWRARAFFGVRL